MGWKCPVCGKEFEHFGIKEFAMCPKTTLFGDFKYKDTDGVKASKIMLEECGVKYTEYPQEKRKSLTLTLK